MSFFVRLKRYVQLISWLIYITTKIQPLLVFLAVFSSVFSRLCTVTGFLFTVKIATWLIAPDLINDEIQSYFPVDNTYMLYILCCVPSLFFVLAAIFQKNYELMRTSLAAKLAEVLTLKKTKTELIQLDEYEFKNRKLINNVGSQVRKCHRSLWTIAILELELISSVFVFSITLLVGFLISPIIMVTIFTICMILSIGFIFVKHSKSYREFDKMLLAREASQQKINEINSFTSGNIDSVERLERLNKDFFEYIRLLSNVSRIQKVSNSNTTFFIEIGQALIVATFLYVLIGYNNIDQFQISNIIIFALLLRFMISYLKSIVQSFIKINGFYSFILELKEI